MSVHFRKGNKTWYVHWRENGKQRTRTFGPGKENKKLAEAFDLEVRASKKRGERSARETVSAASITMSQLGQMYLDDAKTRDVTIQTRKALAFVLNTHLIPEHGDTPVCQLSYHDVVGFIGQIFQDRAQATRNRYLSYLRAMFNFGVRHELIEKSPLKLWKKVKEAPRRVLLTPADLAKIKEHAAPHLAWAIEVEWHTGLRPGRTELFALRYEHVDFEAKQINVLASKTKTWREIPVSEEFLERIQEKQQESESGYIVEYKGKPIRKIRHSYQSACKRAGITYETTMYDLRHLFATTLLNNGADLAAVSKLLGHSSITMTANQYYHLLKGAKRQAVSLLPKLQAVDGG